MIAELRTFIAAARLGTFTRAGDKVGLTQAAVSAQMKRLEQHLGFELFVRSPRSAPLNAAGVRLLPRAQAILDMFDKLGDLDGHAAPLSLHVGSIASIQSSILAQALVAFRATYPNCAVHVVPGMTMHLIDQVKSGDLDLAIVARPLSDFPPNLAWHRLTREPYVLIAPPECPGETWQDILQSQPFLRHNGYTPAGSIVNRFLGGLPFAVNEAHEVPLQAMVTMVGNGVGVALVPITEAPAPRAGGIRVLPLEGATLAREIGFLRSGNVEPAPAGQHLAECLFRSVASWPAI